MLLSLFGRKDKTNEQDNNPVSPSSLPRAVAFVDYESWYVSLKTTYAIAPDIKGWFEELNRHYQLIDVTFFADFSHRSLADELRRIRPYTNKIIDTRSPNGVEKDYTDFIMLDNIYQKALSASDIQTFILFSGDGHFSSVVAFLKNFYHKEVVVYGIRDCFSRQLQESASRTVTLPNETQVNSGIYRSVFEYQRRSYAPTFEGAYAWLTERHKNVSPQVLRKALELLEKREVLSQHSLDGRKQKQLFVNWEKAEPWLDVPLSEFFERYPEPDLHEPKQHQNPPHFALKNADKHESEEKTAQARQNGGRDGNGKQETGADKGRAQAQPQGKKQQQQQPQQQKAQPKEQPKEKSKEQPKEQLKEQPKEQKKEPAKAKEPQKQKQQPQPAPAEAETQAEQKAPEQQKRKTRSKPKQTPEAKAAEANEPQNGAPDAAKGQTENGEQQPKKQQPKKQQQQQPKKPEQTPEQNEKAPAEPDPQPESKDQAPEQANKPKSRRRHRSGQKQNKDVSGQGEQAKEPQADPAESKKKKRHSEPGSHQAPKPEEAKEGQPSPAPDAGQAEGQQAKPKQSTGRRRHKPKSSSQKPAEQTSGGDKPSES